MPHIKGVLDCGLAVTSQFSVDVPVKMHQGIELKQMFSTIQGNKEIYLCCQPRKKIKC